MTAPSTGADHCVRAIVDRCGADTTYMLQILREVQEQRGWISSDIIDILEAALKVPRT